MGFVLSIWHWSYLTWGEHSCRWLRNLSWYALYKEFRSNNYILNLCGGLCSRSLFARRTTNKRRSKKMTCTRSAFSINFTPGKISIKIPNKIKWRRSGVPNPKFKCVFEILEDLLNDLSMWIAWRSWITGRQRSRSTLSGCGLDSVICHQQWWRKEWLGC
jgi:hypothetical protein